MKLGQGERKTLLKESGILGRVKNRQWRTRAPFESSSQVPPSQTESIYFGCSQGLISQILYHIFPVHCHIKMQTEWAWAQRGVHKARSWAIVSKVELMAGSHISYTKPPPCFSTVFLSTFRRISKNIQDHFEF